MFYLNSDYAFNIKTGTDETTEEAIMSVLAKGLTDVEPSGNEEVDQTPYLDGDGFAESDVTGGQITYAFSGHRFIGDTAQDYIYDLKFKLGNARRTEFEITAPDGSKISGPGTIVNIEGPSGAANAKGEISFGIHFNGKPEFTPAP